MPQVLEHIAELTGYRDRDLLDVTLVGALKDVLQPSCVAIYRCVGDEGAQRWLTRARQRADEPAASADPLWSDLEALPRLADHPERMACLQLGERRQVAGEVSLTLFPLVTERDVAGVLEIETARPLAPAETALVSGILRVYRNFQALLDYSERDTLTGLLNRKTFDDSFLRHVPSAREVTSQNGVAAGDRRVGAASSAWIGVVDVDHFKAVNDSFGHLIGDEVLLLLSRLMRNCFRLYDQLFRFGGEEFVVLLRTNNAADAAAAFERLRATVQRYPFPQVGSITVSVGFSQVRPDDAPSGAFERADKAVYYAKQQGRNRVADYGDLVARGVFEEGARESDVELF